jgi:uncharacterized phiE125 gp8 family phage protein
MPLTTTDLYTVPDLKAHLRVQHTADDVLLSALAQSAVSLVESYIHRPILPRVMTFTDDATPSGGGRVARLLCPVWPVGDLVSVVHDDGDTLDVARLIVNPLSGAIRAADGAFFRHGPYTITATVGLGTHPDFAAAALPALQQAIRDVVADLYLRRNPGASQENEGGGVTVSYAPGDAQGIPLRTAAILRPWRLVVA